VNSDLNFGEPPTPEQHAIITRPLCEPRPMKVVAGAGTGKTETLANRFAYLVVHEGVAPERLLAITFTEKAAGELEARVRAKLKLNGVPPLEQPLWIGTFHGVALRLLRENHYAAGLPRDLRVEADAAQERRLDRLILRGLEGEYGDRYPALSLEVLAALPFAGTDPLRDLLVRLLRAARGSGLAPGAFEQRLNEVDDRVFGALPSAAEARAWGPKKGVLAPALAERLASAGLPGHGQPLTNDQDSALRKLYFTNLVGQGVAREQAEAAFAAEREALRRVSAAAAVLTELYAAELERDGALDYDDLISRTVALLQIRTDLRAEYQARFASVMVDEFQDTSPEQMELIRLLARPGTGSALPTNLLIVGDKKQSIYRWRNARRENMDRMLPDEEGIRLPLSVNYRSLPRIIALANDIGARLEAGDPQLQAQREGEGCIYHPPLFGGGDLPVAKERERESEWIAEAIQRLVTEGHQGRKFQYEEIAVLIRTNRRFGSLREAFLARNIPYHRGGGAGFFEEPLAQVLIAYLRVLADPLDEAAFALLLSRPPVGLTDRQLYLLRRVPRSPQDEADTKPRVRSFYEGQAAAISGEDPEAHAELPLSRLEELSDRLAQLRGAEPAFPLARFLDRVAQGTGILAGLAPLQAGAWLGIRGSLLAVIRELVAESPHAGLTELAETLQTYERNPLLRLPAGEEAVGDGVQILSMHQSKGLEYPVVFLTGFKNGGLPRTNWGYDERWGLIPTSLDGEPSAKATLFKTLSGSRDEEADDEERLWYVAATRARDLLIVSHAAGAQGSFPFAGDLEHWAHDPDWTLAPDLLSVTRLPESEIPLFPRRAAAVHGGAQVFRTSFSALMTLEECPAKLYIREVWRLPEALLRLASNLEPQAGDEDLPIGDAPAGGLPLGTILGKAIHGSIAAYYLERFPETEDRPRLTAQFGSLTTEGVPTETYERALVLFRAFRESRWSWLRPAPYDVERPVAVRFAPDGLDGHGVVLHGAIDLFDRTVGGAILDFKTNARLGEAEVAHYTLQAQIYTLALRSEGLRPERAPSLVHLTPEGPRDVELRLTSTVEADLDRRLRDYVAVRTSIGVPLPNQMPPCDGCTFQRFCPHALV